MEPRQEQAREAPMPSNIIRILLIEGDHNTSQVVKDLLENSKRGSFIVEAVETAKEGFARLEDNGIDLVIAGDTGEQSNGLDFLQEFHAKRFHIPIIALTPHGDKSAQVNAIADGASEYLERGMLNVELLERTCFYAINLAEKKRVNGNNSPGIGMLVEQLVDLTRESVKAQTEQTHELQELRKNIDTGFGNLKKDFSKHQEEHTRQHKEIIEEIHNSGTIRWVLDWIVLHPAVAVAMLAAAVIAVTVVVLLIHIVDTQKIKGIKDAVSMTEMGVAWLTGKMPPWID